WGTRTGQTLAARQAARARVGGHRELKPRGVTSNASRPMKDELPGLQWLAKGVEHPTGELRCLVQEEHTAVRTRRRSRSWQAAATADHRSGGRGVVRRLEGRAMQEAVGGIKGAG